MSSAPDNTVLPRLRPASRVGRVGCGLLLAAAGGISNLAAETAPQDSAAVAVAERLTAAGIARDAGRWQEAADRYRQALALDPASPEAREGLRMVSQVLAGKADGLQTDDGREAVRHQLAVVEARAAIERADLLIRSGRHAEAEAALARARAVLLNDTDRATVAEDLGRVGRLLQEVEAGHVRTQASVGVADRAKALANAEQHAKEQASYLNSRFEERIARIRALLGHRHNELALNAARRLVTEVPGNPQAEEIFNEALVAVHKQRNADLNEQNIELKKEVLARLHDSLIPTGIDGKPIYPPNWLENHPSRIELGSESAELEPWHEDLLNRLASRVTVDFENLAIDEALAFISKVGAFNLIIDPSVLAGGSKVATLRATDIRIDNVLTWLGRLTDCTWAISKEAVYFGGQHQEDSVLAVYDLAHLVFSPADEGGYKVAWNSGTGAGAANIFAEEAQSQGAAVSPEDLVDMIKTVVSPGTWDLEGRRLDIRSSVLYVSAPRTTHKLLQEFLRSQAYARSQLVHVTCRWLTISDTYLEQIGVDWGSAQSLLQLGGSIPVQGYQDRNQSAVWGGNVLNVLPASAVTNSANLANRGLNLSALFLDHSQWSAMLQAVELKGQGRILASPELTTLNGIRSNTFIGQQLAYIADYEVVNNNLDPTISVLTVGATLSIKPFISADRKYVTMEFNPAIASATFFTDLIAAPRVIGSGDGGGVVTGNLAYPIELPNVAIDEVATTIVVPDHGVLLVGGFNKSLDQQTSAKVPFLGHIPYLGRLFGTRGRFSERTKLFVLTSVDIIDYHEAEENL